MKTYTYHKEIRTILAQVLNALGDLVIKRLNETDDDDEGNADRIGVNLVYAPKQRVIHDLVNKSQHIKVPVMAITMGNLSYDSGRAFNKIMGFTLSENYLSGGGSFPEPVPIQINLNFSILTRYQRDMDQIITCIFSNFYPYIVISYQHPDTNHEVRCVVNWNGDLNFSYPSDVGSNVPYRITADSTFTVQGWIFKNASNPYGIIHNIPTTFTSVSSIFDDYYTNSYNAMEVYKSDIATDFRVVSGRPEIENVSPYLTDIAQSTAQEFNITGDMFQFVNMVVVSAEPQAMFPLSSYQLLNPFLNSERLSGVYGPFSAVPILTSEWYGVNDFNLRFSIPTPQVSGYVDILAISPMGIGQLTVDSVRPTFNPYVSGTSAYNSYQEFQFPAISGIEVRT